ncbi:MAG: hypothetical protein WCV82_00480 [Candidatus Paceibacterota bacterium]
MNAQRQFNELEWLEDLADRVSERIRVKRIAFKIEFLKRYRQQHPHDDDELVRNSTLVATRPHEHGFFVQAMGEIITREIASRGEAVYFRVSRILSKRHNRHRMTNNRQSDPPRHQKGSLEKHEVQVSLVLGRSLAKGPDSPVGQSLNPALLAHSQHIQHQPPSGPKRALQIVFSLTEEVDRECAGHNFLAHELGLRRHSHKH